MTSKPIRLPNYTRGEADWPALWRLCPDDFDEGDLYDKMAACTDDVLLREAIHIWDNAFRLPGTVEGIVGGMLSAHARFVVGLNGPDYDLDRATEAVAKAWRGMAEQFLALSPKRPTP